MRAASRRCTRFYSKRFGPAALRLSSRTAEDPYPSVWTPNTSTPPRFVLDGCSTFHRPLESPTSEVVRDVYLPAFWSRIRVPRRLCSTYQQCEDLPNGNSKRA